MPAPGRAPLGIYPATLIARAWNSPITIVLYFSTETATFCLSVRARYAFAPRYGGPSFDQAPLHQKYILAVRLDRSKEPILDYAMAFSP